MCSLSTHAFDFSTSLSRSVRWFSFLTFACSISNVHLRTFGGSFGGFRIYFTYLWVPCSKVAGGLKEPWNGVPSASWSHPSTKATKVCVMYVLFLWSCFPAHEFIFTAKTQTGRPFSPSCPGKFPLEWLFGFVPWVPIFPRDSFDFSFSWNPFRTEANSFFPRIKILGSLFVGLCWW